MKRKNFYDPLELKEDVESKVLEIRANGIRLDYLSFVLDGEPTLEKKLGKEIDLVSSLGIDVSVISNDSPICNNAVKSNLAKAGWK